MDKASIKAALFPCVRYGNTSYMAQLPFIFKHN